MHILEMIWIVVDRNRKKFINFVIGKRDINTEKKLWQILETKKIDNVMTDHYQSYNSFIPDEKHIRSKAETFTVEGYNSLFHHFLARMRRKSKCYSKSMRMLVYSLNLLICKWNDGLGCV